MRHDPYRPVTLALFVTMLSADEEKARHALLQAEMTTFYFLMLNEQMDCLPLIEENARIQLETERNAQARAMLENLEMDGRAYIKAEEKLALQLNRKETSKIVKLEIKAREELVKMLMDQRNGELGKLKNSFLLSLKEIQKKNVLAEKKRKESLAMQNRLIKINSKLRAHYECEKIRLGAAIVFLREVYNAGRVSSHSFEPLFDFSSQFQVLSCLMTDALSSLRDDRNGREYCAYRHALFIKDEHCFSSDALKKIKSKHIKENIAYLQNFLNAFIAIIEGNKISWSLEAETILNELSSECNLLSCYILSIELKHIFLEKQLSERVSDVIHRVIRKIDEIITNEIRGDEITDRKGLADLKKDLFSIKKLIYAVLIYPEALCESKRTFSITLFSLRHPSALIQANVNAVVSDYKKIFLEPAAISLFSNFAKLDPKNTAVHPEVMVAIQVLKQVSDAIINDRDVYMMIEFLHEYIHIFKNNPYFKAIVISRIEEIAIFLCVTRDLGDLVHALTLKPAELSPIFQERMGDEALKIRTELVQFYIYLSYNRMKLIKLDQQFAPLVEDFIALEKLITDIINTMVKKMVSERLFTFDPAFKAALRLFYDAFSDVMQKEIFKLAELVLKVEGSGAAYQQDFRAVLPPAIFDVRESGAARAGMGAAR